MPKNIIILIKKVMYKTLTPVTCMILSKDRIAPFNERVVNRLTKKGMISEVKINNADSIPEINNVLNIR